MLALYISQHYHSLSEMGFIRFKAVSRTADGCELLEAGPTGRLVQEDINGCTKRTRPLEVNIVARTHYSNVG